LIWLYHDFWKKKVTEKLGLILDSKKLNVLILLITVDVEYV